MTRARATAAGRRNGVSTKDEWAARAVHTITLSSGTVVKVRFPDLGTLLKSGRLPDTLRGAALEVVNREAQIDAQVTAALKGGPIEIPPLELDDITGLTELRLWLAAEMVVEPEITIADLDQDGALPKEDSAMLAAIATRERNTDALGVRLGVERLSDYERFLRGFECDPGCAHCAKNRDGVSAGRMVPV